jgi:hypothetical protein
MRFFIRGLLPLVTGVISARHVAAGTHASGVAAHTTHPARPEAGGPVDAGLVRHFVSDRLTAGQRLPADSSSAAGLTDGPATTRRIAISHSDHLQEVVRRQDRTELYPLRPR